MFYQLQLLLPIALARVLSCRPVGLRLQARHLLLVAMSMPAASALVAPRGCSSRVVGRWPMMRLLRRRGGAAAAAAAAAVVVMVAAVVATSMLLLGERRVGCAMVMTRLLGQLRFN